MRQLLHETPCFDALESRRLAAVGLVGTTVVVRADQVSHNQAFFYHPDTAGAQIEVDLNGKASVFDSSAVSRIVYDGGFGGGDYVENDLGLDTQTVDFLFGGGNNFNGGGFTRDDIFAFGDGNQIVTGTQDVVALFGNDDIVYVSPEGSTVVVDLGRDNTIRSLG